MLVVTVRTASGQKQLWLIPAAEDPSSYLMEGDRIEHVARVGSAKLYGNPPCKSGSGRVLEHL